MSKPGYYASHPHKRKEFYLLQLAKGKDPETARNAANSLIIGNEGYLKNTLLKWSEKGYEFDFDELYGEAMIAFYQAIVHYDPDQDVSIRTYSRFFLLKLRRRFFRKRRWIEFKPEHIPDTTEIEFKEGQELNLTETLYDAINTCLTPVEKEVIVLHFIKKLTRRRIGNLRGCSERRIGIVITNALPKLKSYLQQRGVNLSSFVKN